MHSDEAQGPLTRWSRRKLAARQAATAPAGEPATEAAAERTVAPAAATTEPAPPDPAPLPPVESLGEDSDYAPFLSPEVDEGVRRLALRRLFSQSCFNVCDGLDDYAEDFTRHAPLGDVVTHEARRALAREARRLAETESDTEDPTETGGEALAANETQPPAPEAEETT